MTLDEATAIYVARSGLTCEAARKLAAKFLIIVREKNTAALLAYLYLQNPASIEIFRKETGLTPPKRITRRWLMAAIWEWVGEPKWTAYHAKEQAEREERAAEVAKRSTLRQLTGRVRHNGNVVTRREFLDDILADGYTQLATRRQGCVPVVHLGNGEGRYYILRLRAERDYVEGRLAEMGIKV